MRKVLKILGVLLVLVALLAIGGVLVLELAFPRVAQADQRLKVEATPERLARGTYVANHVVGCIGCHSQQDWRTYGHPVVPGTEGQGGDTIFGTKIGLPGEVYPKNITPFNLKQYSDGELVRVLRTGVRKNGEPLFPLMPYQALAEMEQEDLYSVIVYLRSLPERPSVVPEHQLQFPVNLIVRTIPKDAPPYPAPVDRKNSVAYGNYLVRMGGCTNCHTPVNSKQEPLPGMFLAGGEETPVLDNQLQRHKGGGVMRTPNLTPDNETGIGAWTKEAFLARFAAWRGAALESQHRKLDLDKGDYQEIMPYTEFAGMTDEDLGAIYDYLRTVPPVKHAVVRFEPPKLQTP